jgi:Copper type II ascorbate-dependent monooxygenase, C-terminal domain
MHFVGTRFSCVLLFSLAALAQSDHENLTGNVTFHKDVLPILQAKCQTCHRPGEIAPMSFLSYQTTRPWAKAIRAAILTKKMPPWGADPRYGKFANDPSLTQVEIDTIVNWVDRGALEGDAKDAPPPVQWPEGWRSKPDVIVSLPAIPVPAKGYVEWTDMIIPNPFQKDTWVESVEIRPGVPSVVHHAGVRFVPHKHDVQYYVPTWGNYQRDQAGYKTSSQPKAAKVTYCQDEQSKLCPAPANAIPQPGSFEGFYRPGSGPIDYRYYNSAYLVPGNTDIVVQMHYSPNGTAVTDVTKIGFTIAKSAPKQQLKMYGLQPAGGTNNRETFRIPAGDPNWKSPPADVVFNVDTELAVFSVHMHERGKAMLYTLTYPDGKSEIVFSEPHYNFNWQLYYDLAKPIKISKGTKLHIDAWYDNSANNPFNRDPARDVYGGEQSWEEMMAPWIGLILPTDANIKTAITVNPGVKTAGDVGDGTAD